MDIGDRAVSHSSVEAGSGPRPTIGSGSVLGCYVLRMIGAEPGATHLLPKPRKAVVSLLMAGNFDALEFPIRLRAIVNGEIESQAKQSVPGATWLPRDRTSTTRRF